MKIKFHGRTYTRIILYKVSHLPDSFYDHIYKQTRERHTENLGHRYSPSSMLYIYDTYVDRYNLMDNVNLYTL